MDPMDKKRTRGRKRALSGPKFISEGRKSKKGPFDGKPILFVNQAKFL